MKKGGGLQMNDYIIDEFYEDMKKVKFEAFGILDSDNKIHTLGTDSKIIGRIIGKDCRKTRDDIDNT